jgi:hypothetical protein
MRDIDVRRAVKSRLAAAHAGEIDTRIVEEMGVWSGSVRIDIAVVNGSLSGYELKSDRDTLERLPRQVRLYGHVFDFLYLVVGKRHAEKAKEMIPDWWGIQVAVVASGGIDLLPHREAALNPSPSPYLIAELLSKPEALGVLESFDLAKGWRSKKIRQIHQRLAGELSLDELKEQVRSALKERSRGFTASSIELVQGAG